MADRIYGINRGQTKNNVTEGSVSPAANVEVVIDLAANMTRSEVLIKLEEISEYILEHKWPPA